MWITVFRIIGFIHCLWFLNFSFCNNYRFTGGWKDSTKKSHMPLVHCVCVVLYHFITCADACNHHHHWDRTVIAPQRLLCYPFRIPPLPPHNYPSPVTNSQIPYLYFCILRMLYKWNHMPWGLLRLCPFFFPFSIIPLRTIKIIACVNSSFFNVWIFLNSMCVFQFV